MQITPHRRADARALRLAFAAAAASLALAAPAGASMVTFGPDLATVPAPTLDTANGAAAALDDEPLSLWNSTQNTGSSDADEAIATSYSRGCTRVYSGEGVYRCTPWMHTGADNTIWNISADSQAPQGGQALEVDVKGCTVRDNSPGNTSQSPTGDGGFVPSNSIEFQTLTPQSAGAFKADATAGLFQLPWCSDSADPADAVAAVNTSTITAFHPLHMCLGQGDTVSFYDVGGTVIPPSGPAFYPQGAPFTVIAPVPGVSTDSFTDADAAAGEYAPGSRPRGDNSGWGSESGQEVMLAVVEGTGDDAYGLCPGGHAVEPADANSVICVTAHTNPGDPYGTCNAQEKPVFAPVNTSSPTIAGTAQVGDWLNVTHGTWTNEPYGYATQWLRCDSSGANCAPIPGATGSCYRLAAADLGHTIEVSESAMNDANTEGPVSSAPTAGVAEPPPSAGRIAAALHGEIVPCGKLASAAAVLDAGGFIYTSFSALEAGSVTADWSVGGGARTTLIATGSATFAAPGDAKLRVQLTAAGRRLLAKRGGVKLTAHAVFRSAGHAAVTATTAFTLRHR